MEPQPNLPISKPPRNWTRVRYGIYAVITIIGLLAFGYSMNKKTIDYAWERHSENLKTTICLRRGGKLISLGCGISRCSETCVPAYKDAGKPCTNSSQCTKHCVVWDNAAQGPLNQYQPIAGCRQVTPGQYDCRNVPLTTKCEDWPTVCDYRWEFNNGSVKMFVRPCPIG